jgi:TolB-like protein/cytochrome c-type biogenesis protein CcmH/NrfG
MGDPDESAPQHDDAPRKAPGGSAPSPPVAPAKPSPDDFWARIRRHKVVEWTLAYVAFGYAMLHGVQMLRETFDWPFLVPRLTVFGLVLGAPIAVTLAWYHGHRERHRVSGQELSILIALLVGAGSVLWWVSRHSHDRTAAPATAVATNGATADATPFNPPPHSIAVLPFVNMSGDKEQEYFSEGLTEELLNSLSRINELQVAARTSSFSFQGEHPDIATVAHKLNVGTVLEGSVRRSSNTVRITTQLVNGMTGFHLWSATYDRDLGDVLKLQTEIATAVANALKVTLLGDEAARIELGGTRNPGAFDAFLRGSKAFGSEHDPKSLQEAIAAYTEAIRLDPNYALAFAGRSRVYSGFAWDFATGTTEIRDSLDKAQADARQALALAPGLAEGYLALGAFWRTASVDYTQGTRAYEQALALAPGNAEVLRESGRFAVYMGRFDAGITALRRAHLLDPLNQRSLELLGEGLYFARRYDEAVAAFTEAATLDPNNPYAQAFRGLAFIELGNPQSARSTCETKPDYWTSQLCLAVVYDKLGRHADAEGVLATMKAANGDDSAYQYAAIYARWANKPKALEWLDTAMRLRDPGLVQLKTDPLMDPLRNEPRFQAIERALKFPE